MFRPCLQNKTTLCRDSEGTYLPPDKISQVVISRPLREVIPSIDQVREQQANGRAAFLSVGSLAHSETKYATLSSLQAHGADPIWDIYESGALKSDGFLRS